MNKLALAVAAVLTYAGCVVSSGSDRGEELRREFAAPLDLPGP